MLCDKSIISSGGNYPPFIYIFVGKKFWKFDGLAKPSKPFGDLSVGNKLSTDEFDGIHMPGGVSFNKNAFIVVYKSTWSQWKPLDKEKHLHKNMRQNDNEISNAPIGWVVEEREEVYKDLGEGDPLDSGALIVLNEMQNRFAKVKGKQICYYIINQNKCSLIGGKCSQLNKDSNNFPSNIIALIKDRDKNSIFFDGIGKHCIRKDKNKNGV